MSKKNGPYIDGDMQFWSKKTNKSLISIVDSFEIDKVKIEFRTFDMTKEKGSKISNSVDFYFSMPEFEMFCRDILSGNISKDAQQKKIAAQQSGSKFPELTRKFEGGSKKTMKARILTVSSGNSQPFVFTAYSGPAKINETTGGVVPAFKYNEAESRVMIGLTSDELKLFAITGLRACDHYYMHYFGRYDPNNK